MEYFAFFTRRPWLAPAALGALCLLLARTLSPWTPHLLGAVMVAVGLRQLWRGIRTKEYRRRDAPQPARGIVLILVGSIPLVQGAQALELTCALWGVFGLVQGARSLNRALYEWSTKNPFLLSLLLSAAEIFLALELIFSTGASVTAHVYLLGVELLIGAWDTRRQTAKKH